MGGRRVIGQVPLPSQFLFYAHGTIACPNDRIIDHVRPAITLDNTGQRLQHRVE